MHFYFNELCVGQPLPDQNSANEALGEFVLICRALKNRGFKDIIAAEIDTFKILRNSEIAPKYYVYDWLKDTKFDTDVRNQLRSIFSKSPPLKIVVDELIESRVDSPERIAKGLNIAYLQGSIAVSILNEPCWNTNEISISHLDISSDYSNIAISALVRHIASFQSHFPHHLTWIESLTGKNISPPSWNPSKEYFPRKYEANYCVLNCDWSDFYIKLNSLGTREKIALCLTKGEEIARIHGYEYNSKVSGKNKGSIRKIFSAGNADERIYLSIDVRNGRFEVCDNNGDHIAEYLFSGELNDGTAKPDHSITV